MKRFLFFFMSMTLAMGSIAFGAEKETKLVVDGAEWNLKNPFWNRNGKMMISVEDFADIVDGTYQDLGENALYLEAGAQESAGKPVWLDATYDFWIAKQESNNIWNGLVQGYLGENGKWYVPVRDAADAVNLKTEWSRGAGEAVINLAGATMPRLSMNVTYDAEADTVTVTLRNEEPQEFMFGDDYFLQKWNGEAWEKMPLVEDRCYDDIGFILPGYWQNNGMSTKTFRTGFYGEDLEAGRYRLCVPISYTSLGREAIEHYAISKPVGSDLETETDRKVLGAWATYFQTPQSEPAFFAKTASAEEWRARTDYVVSGEFEVK